jgi:hypothetical protein
MPLAGERLRPRDGRRRIDMSDDAPLHNPVNRHGLELRATIDDVLLWSAVALSPLQDTALQKTPLALVAASPAVFPLLGLLFLHVMRRMLRLNFAFRRWTLLAAGYVLMTSLAHFVARSHGVTVLEWRSLRGSSILAILLFFTLFGVNYRDTRGIRIAVYIAMAITLIGIVVGAVLGANAIPLLQATPSNTGRPSGFSTEASTLSVQTVCIGILMTHFMRGRWQKACVALLTCALLVYSQSKGGLISLLLCVTILGVIKSRSSLATKVLVASIVIPVLYLGSLLVASMFGDNIDTNQTSSVATRLSMAVFAIITVAHNPLGVGFTGFLPAIRDYLPGAMTVVQSWFPIPLGFGEVSGYLEPPYQDADCKSFFFNYFVFFGIPFAIVFFQFAFRVLRRLLAAGCDSLFVGVLFCLFALMTYYSTTNSYSVAILFGVALREVRRIEDTVRLH